MSCQNNYNQLVKQNQQLVQENTTYKNTINNVQSSQQNSINSFIDKATSALSCDSDCQNQNTIDQLKQTYLDAKTNLVTAPSQVETSFKNYLVYLEGEPAYLEYRENELEAKADIYNKLDIIKEEHLPRGFGPKLIGDMYTMLKMQLSFDEWNENKNLLLYNFVYLLVI